MKRIISFLSVAFVLATISCTNESAKKEESIEVKTDKDVKEVKPGSKVEVTVPAPPPPPPPPKIVIKTPPLPQLPPPPPPPPLPPKPKRKG